MTVAVEKLQKWLDAKEDEHLEFEGAKANFHFGTLVKYGVALANEGGGKIILGVTDKAPRTVVGSQAFQDLERTKAGLIERLRLRVDVEEIRHPDGRVLVFQVPSRPIGTPIQYEGAYWMRGGQDLVPMTPDVLQRIFAEAGPDFSAEICRPARMDDLGRPADRFVVCGREGRFFCSNRCKTGTKPRQTKRRNTLKNKGLCIAPIARNGAKPEQICRNTLPSITT